MPSRFRRLTRFIGAAALVAPALLAAQPSPGGPGGPGGPVGRGPQGPGRAAAPGVDVTTLLNARRQLDLTPRQVAQLDSLERIQHAERSKFRESMAVRRDSMMQRLRTARGAQGARGGEPGNANVPRDSMRARMRSQIQGERAALQPQFEQLQRRDSTFRVAAERLLNDTQRQKVREMQAERRGYER
ncbi:MAG: hypothetical protein ACKVS7_03335, partial [Gemmatimonadaceae bacterium]